MKFFSSLLLIFMLLPPAHANPGAWVQAKGNLQIINNLTYYHSNERFDAAGGKVPTPTFQQFEYNPYIEYGLWDHTTIGANLFLQRVKSQGDTNWGLADAEFFTRTQLWKTNPAWKQSELVLAIQPLVKIPGIYDDSATPIIGSDDPDVALSLFAGYSFNYFTQKTFTEHEVQYRHRFGTPEDQIRLNSTFGQDISEKWQVLAQSFTTLSTDTVRGSTFTQSARDDYDLVKVQLTGLYQLNDRISLQGGAFYNITGRNTGNGIGGLFSIWHRF